MKTQIIKLLFSAALLFTLSACSYIKSLFPDKEKDYQYTTEIPPLILPADLNNTLIPGVHTSASAPSPTTFSVDNSAVPPVGANDSSLTTVQDISKPGVNSTIPGENAAVSTLPESESTVTDTAITVERVNSANGEDSLRLNVPYAKAWRIVSKALSRRTIEVTERDQEAKLFTVQYDPEEQKISDGSYWDEVVFMFKGIQSNEKTYLLKLEEFNQQTEIVVLDEDQQRLSDAASVKLLSLLEETIKADLANK